MIRIIVCLLLLSFINSVTAQDTTKFERVYIWEHKSSELSGSGKQFASSLCYTIRNYVSNNKSVVVLVVEERLQSISSTLIERRTDELKKYCVEKESDLINVEFKSNVEYVKDFKHIEPHFISYYVKLIVD
jgi:predicted AlkP superfamily pyrophosphatase or phosphodiesterase